MFDERNGEQLGFERGRLDYRSRRSCLWSSHLSASEKKTGVVEDDKAFGHAGVLFDGPPGNTGVPFV
jgi:hypothetical protein